MKRVFIVQARMTSTRLPGKVLMDLDGRPMLTRLLNRLQRATTADALVVACTTNPEDDRIEHVATEAGVGAFRGSEHDVLARFIGAAREYDADVAVRITADCPLICPEICDRVVSHLGSVDYASNTLVRTFPRGLDCEAVSREALERAAREATTAQAREHVTWHIVNHQADYRLHSVEERDDWSHLRWTVDERDDLRAVRQIWLGADMSRRFLGYRDILRYVTDHPEVVAVNQHVAQKAH